MKDNTGDSKQSTYRSTPQFRVGAIHRWHSYPVPKNYLTTSMSSRSYFRSLVLELWIYFNADSADRAGGHTPMRHFQGTTSGFARAEFEDEPTASFVRSTVSIPCEL